MNANTLSPGGLNRRDPSGPLGGRLNKLQIKPWYFKSPFRLTLKTHQRSAITEPYSSLPVIVLPCTAVSQAMTLTQVRIVFGLWRLCRTQMNVFSLHMINSCDTVTVCCWRRCLWYLQSRCAMHDWKILRVHGANTSLATYLELLCLPVGAQGSLHKGIWCQHQQLLLSRERLKPLLWPLLPDFLHCTCWEAGVQ